VPRSRYLAARHWFSVMLQSCLSRVLRRQPGTVSTDQVLLSHLATAVIAGRGAFRDRCERLYSYAPSLHSESSTPDLPSCSWPPKLRRRWSGSF